MIYKSFLVCSTKIKIKIGFFEKMDNRKYVIWIFT